MPTEKKKKKYTLFNNQDGRPNSDKPCAFFFSDVGCRNGEKCQFKHSSDEAGSVSDISEVPEVQSSKPVAHFEESALSALETAETERKRPRRRRKSVSAKTRLRFL